MFTMSTSSQTFHPFILSFHNNRRSSSQVFCEIGVLVLCSQHSQQNPGGGVSFSINIVAGSLFKKRLERWSFPNSYAKVLTTTFLILNKL